MTVKELKFLLNRIVKDSLADAVEDVEALASKRYIKSIEQARKEYKEGQCQRLEDVIDV